MEQRISIITLGVSDLQASADFYLTKFGWTKSDSSNEEIIFIHLNGMYLSLYGKEKLAEDAEQDAESSGFPSFSLAYNTRSEEEVDQLFSKFESQGIKIIKKPKKVFWGGYSGYIADPDGYLWEIAFNPFIKVDEAGNTK